MTGLQMNIARSWFGAAPRDRMTAAVGCLLAVTAVCWAYDGKLGNRLQLAGRIVILDVVVGERSPTRLGIREETPGKLAVTGGPTLELTPKIDGEVVELSVVEVVAGEGIGEETRRALSVLRLSKATATTLEVGST